MKVSVAKYNYELRNQERYFKTQYYCFQNLTKLQKWVICTCMEFTQSSHLSSSSSKSKSVCDGVKFHLKVARDFAVCSMEEPKLAGYIALKTYTSQKT